VANEVVSKVVEEIQSKYKLPTQFQYGFAVAVVLVVPLATVGSSYWAASLASRQKIAEALAERGASQAIEGIKSAKVECDGLLGQMKQNLALPVGVVIPLFLTPDEVKKLEPVWLPADGREVELAGVKRKLPNMIGRFAMGAPFSMDVTREASDAESKVTGTTSGANLIDPQSRRHTTQVVPFEKPPSRDSIFLLDTEGEESMWSGHNHDLPTRKLIYLVKVQ
jgi:hypothetical protein